MSLKILTLREANGYWFSRIPNPWAKTEFFEPGSNVLPKHCPNIVPNGPPASQSVIRSGFARPLG